MTNEQLKELLNEAYLEGFKSSDFYNNGSKPLTKNIEWLDFRDMVTDGMINKLKLTNETN